MDLQSFVLAASTADLAEERRARADADAVELRLDLADAPLEQLDDYDGDLPLIATDRMGADGGRGAAGSDHIDVLEGAVARPSVDAVDVELAVIEDGGGSRVVEAARKADVAVVVSVHDVEGTPDRETMARTLQAAASAGDIGKLAVTATDPGDALALLRVTWELSARGVPVATMAMGAPGRHTRAVAPVYGSRLGYAPLEPERATAPGQYDLATLAALVSELRTRS